MVSYKKTSHMAMLCAIGLLLGSGYVLAQADAPKAVPIPQGPTTKADTRQATAIQRTDGQHDFDPEIGSWKTHVKRLVHPLSGSTIWAEYDGTTVVRKVWGGKGNLAELEADGPAGHLELLSLRLYNPEAHQWSLNVASSKGGTFGVPTIGEFRNGRGEFIDQETFDGRAILVRFYISEVTPDLFRFEQAFSDDGGKTWEANWIATDTRVKTAEVGR